LWIAKPLDDDLLFFKREGGGWPRLNRLFDARWRGAAAVPAGGVGRREVALCPRKLV